MKHSDHTKTNFILSTETKYGVEYVGYYDLPDGREGIYVFYQKNPRTDLGHSNYMGVFFDVTQGWFVTNAKSIVQARFPAIQLPNGKFIVSRYRHDFVQDEDTGKFIDGGLDYTRSNSAVNAYMNIIDGKEIFYANAPTRQDQIGTDRPA